MSALPTAADTLPRLLEELARFSAPGPGVTRRVYDSAWCEAHAWLRDQARVRGLVADCDAAGNLLFRSPDAPLDRPALWIGSHLDTVVHGGRYDGGCGLLAGLLLAAEMRAS